jgi:hypothetical protein
LSNVLQSVTQATFNHEPTWKPTDTTFQPTSGLAALPSVLPDKIAIRDYTSGGTRKRELFVTNSGSGTLSRTPLDSSGHLQTNGSKSVTPVHLIRGANNTFTVPAASAIPLPLLQVVTDQGGTTNVSHLDLKRSGQLPYSSNSRAIAYNASTDKIWVATQFDNQILRVTAADYSTTISQTLNIAAAVATTSERNFFGFGRGFHFREDDKANIPRDGQPTVGNQTCATCHVDGHSDGKVRLTRRININRNGNPFRKPVAVPSSFDVGKTEWIFFEGLRTILDGQFSQDTACNYCDGAGFFDDTEDFTTTLSSPRSPHNWAGTLSGNSLHGRYLFERMNCSRCHMGPVASFVRSEEGNVSQGGPIGEGLQTSNPFLHDPTQVFINTDQGTARTTMTPLI